uniref:Uncharacterized protein n=1 Tax=viral metagenome TaxID=1070528 RepID=A0A6C0D517_9ZZZZ
MSKIKKNFININSVKREICKVYVPLAFFFADCLKICYDIWSCKKLCNDFKFFKFFIFYETL